MRIPPNHQQCRKIYRKRFSDLLFQGRGILRVADTGIGIKDEDLDLLFNPFVQLENNLTRKFEGSGLGLSISKKLMEMLQGKISVESEYGKGTRIILLFPA